MSSVQKLFSAGAVVALCALVAVPSWGGGGAYWVGGGGGVSTNFVDCKNEEHLKDRKDIYDFVYKNAERCSFEDDRKTVICQVKGQPNRVIDNLRVHKSFFAEDQKNKTVRRGRKRALDAVLDFYNPKNCDNEDLSSKSYRDGDKLEKKIQGVGR
ncbi:MAG: hypothetical protein AB7N80_07560 [Bdellovibrionales bacterium]